MTDLLGAQNKNWIENRCSGDLALLHAELGKWDRVTDYVNLAYDVFLKSWISTNPSAITARQFLLQNLQRMVELEDGSLLCANSSRSPQDWNVALKRWNKSQPSRHDPITTWDDVVCGRYAIRSIAKAPIEQINQILADLHTEVALTAISQGILNVVPGQIRAALELKPDKSMTRKEVLTVFNYNKTKLARAKTSKDVDIDVIYKKTIDMLDKELTRTPDDVWVMLLKGDILHDYALHRISVNYDSFSIQDNYSEAFSYLNRATQLTGKPQYSLYAGEAYGKFASFCSSVLQERDGKRDPYSVESSDTEEEKSDDDEIQKKKQKLEMRLPAVSTNDLSSLAVDAYVKGLRFGNKLCRGGILQLVTLTGTYTHTADIALSALDFIPAWFFLQYISQLIGCLGKPNIKDSEGMFFSLIFMSIDS